MRLAPFWRGSLAIALAAGTMLLSVPSGGAAPDEQAHAGSFVWRGP